jgi:hypothetical protein
MEAGHRATHAKRAVTGAERQTVPGRATALYQHTAGTGDPRPCHRWSQHIGSKGTARAGLRRVPGWWGAVASWHNFKHAPKVQWHYLCYG